MKRSVTYVVCICLLFMLGCSKNDIPRGTPACIQTIIDQIRQQDVWNPPAKVFSYVYKGKPVYYVTARCCDIPSRLYDENCNVLCAPDGGFTGSGDGKCVDFFSTRSDEKLIWADSRK